MPTITVTAAEGERLKVTLQEKREVFNGRDANDQPIFLEAWDAKSATQFASEARPFEVTAKQRLVVEVDPA